MHYIKVFIIFIVTTCVATASFNVGSTIFYKRRGRSECWNLDDFAKLKARQMFEGIMPTVVSTDKVDKKYVKDTIRYFRQALQEVERDHDPRTGIILKESLSDAIGGHFRSQLLPTIRLAHYAGYIPCKSARYAHDFFEELKSILNTQGKGWAEPQVPEHSNLSVVKIFIGTGKFVDPCASLITKRDVNSCIHLPQPKVDDREEPTAIALPFTKGGFVSLTSLTAENILLKYYTTASRCILTNSPKKCRHADFVNFNNEMWHWMKRDVAPHLVDEKLYCAYGGVFRIAAAVQSYGKGLSRRNVFEYENASSTWWPWRTLSGKYFNMDVNCWPPSIYIVLVFIAAILICCLQTMYYLFFSSEGCTCRPYPSKPSSLTKDVVYSRIETNIPSAISEHQSAVFYDKRASKVPSKTRSTSLGSIKTQKVYDLNDNTEKMMAVIMSGNEESDAGISSDESYSSNRDSDESPPSMMTRRTVRSKSPPKLETPIAQLKLDSPPRATTRPSRPMYTTSTASRSDVTFCPGRGDSESTYTDTSSLSARSISSVSCKSQSRQSCSIRDLAWARRIVSKHSGQVQTTTRSTTGTDLELNSFTTPPYR